MNFISPKVKSLVTPSQLKRWGLLALLFTMTSSTAWLLLNRRLPEETPAAASTPVVVKTAIATQRPIAVDRTLTGTVESTETVTLTSRVMGQIRQLPVREGDVVQAGQRIAEIDVRDIQAQQQQATAAIPQAQSAVSIAQSAYLTAQAQKSQAQARVQEVQAQLTEAQAELADAQLHQKRMTMLRREGAVSQSRLDEANTRLSVVKARISQAKAGLTQSRTTVKQAQSAVNQAQAQIRQAQAQVEQAQAEVKQTQANLDYGTVIAPFPGVITHKYTEVGAMAGPGESIVKLERSGQLRLSVDVPESLVGQIQRGQSVSVQIDALNRQIAGRISQIIPAADPRSRNFTVKVALKTTQDLLPGMFGRLQFRATTRQNTTARQGLMIPKDALVRQFGVTGVFKVVDHQAQFNPITTGQFTSKSVEVYSGLEKGDRIIVNPSPKLENGTVLQVS
ncbi:efflux RND transporter periplasmic adaptor subunit [Acaryochloris sp. CCMEE 5410]|uniref:efflux RND transporter periplasmic adaptor subunit n=1 Tax=Acaryochloris sp. CCMEE 5410 TaxID=310037 RepID=UPI0002485082|nr:efflux RND transporter periplasmic adaptor subunit [Acaryochloris sp. CCMEE 5410]